MYRILFILILCSLNHCAYAQLGMHYHEVQKKYPGDVDIRPRLYNEHLIMVQRKRVSDDEERWIDYNPDSIVTQVSIKSLSHSIDKSRLAQLIKEETPYFKIDSLMPGGETFILANNNSLMVTLDRYTANGPLLESVTFTTDSTTISTYKYIFSRTGATWIKED